MALKSKFHPITEKALHYTSYEPAILCLNLCNPIFNPSALTLKMSRFDTHQEKPPRSCRSNQNWPLFIFPIIPPFCAKLHFTLLFTQGRYLLILPGLWKQM